MSTIHNIFYSKSIVELLENLLKICWVNKVSLGCINYSGVSLQFTHYTKLDVIKVVLTKAGTEDYWRCVGLGIIWGSQKGGEEYRKCIVSKNVTHCIN